MKKIITAVIMALILSVNAYAGDISSVKATGAVLMDMDSGRVLWGKNEEKPLAMASTTKIMTAILALENGNKGDMVTVSKRAAAAPKVNINLTAGEEVSLENLLYALMLKSANDSAIAIAEHIGGTVEGFAYMMNEKAIDIGAYDTVFVTPNGLDEGEHHSTARDMALIAAYALRNKDFCDIINTPQVSFTSADGKKHYDIVNKNRLLREYKGAFGVKTGFTGKAGHCFVGAAERDGVRLVSCVLASGWGTAGKEYKWSDTKTILDYGFENFKYCTVVDENTETCGIAVYGSDKKTVKTAVSGEIKALLSEDEKNGIEIISVMPEGISAPVKAGQRLGFIRAYKDGFLIGECDISAAESAEEKTVKKSMGKLIYKWFKFEGLEKCL